LCRSSSRRWPSRPFATDSGCPSGVTCGCLYIVAGRQGFELTRRDSACSQHQIRFSPSFLGGVLPLVSFACSRCSSLALIPRSPADATGWTIKRMPSSSSQTRTSAASTSTAMATFAPTLRAPAAPACPARTFSMRWTLVGFRTARFVGQLARATARRRKC
jgi:hypothetical protein